MNKIFKYVLEVTDLQEVDIPVNAINLAVQFQNGDLCLWAIVNPENPKYKRKIRIIGTGHPISEDVINGELKYIGTVQDMGGALIWHVFEVREP